MLRTVEKIFDEQIRPALKAHGGTVEIIDIDNGKLYIKFAGGCHGCSSSTVTVKNGIEALMKQKCPEITEVVDLTDHATGENPYYK